MHNINMLKKKNHMIISKDRKVFDIFQHSFRIKLLAN